LVRRLVPSGDIYDDTGLEHDQIAANIRKQLDEKNGCRVLGQF